MRRAARLRASIASWARLAQAFGARLASPVPRRTPERGPCDVWASGENGALHWDGASWQVADTPSASHLYSAFAAGPRDVWVGGAWGAVLRFRP